MSVEKVALITAGGSGMGADAARRLAADGFPIGILSSSGKGEALGNELGGFGVTGSNRSPECPDQRCAGQMGARRCSCQLRGAWSQRSGAGDIGR